MDDPRRLRFAALACAVALCATQAGCALFVIAGKMFLGDPKVTCAFKAATGVDLTKDRKKLLVVTTTPHAIKADVPSIDQDVTEEVVRRLKMQNVAVIPPDEVSRHLDDLGGTWSHPDDLARIADADYVVHIDLSEFEYREENSPNLFRGRVSGHVLAFAVKGEGDDKRTVSVLDQQFTSTYPSQRPVSVEELSAEAFRKRYLDRVAEQLAMQFYDHRYVEEFD